MYGNGTRTSIAKPLLKPRPQNERSVGLKARSADAGAAHQHPRLAGAQVEGLEVPVGVVVGRVEQGVALRVVGERGDRIAARALHLIQVVTAPSLRSIDDEVRHLPRIFDRGVEPGPVGER